ncbi:histone-lysine N-methyltransferase (Ash1) [Fusarium albosuccineum]|uniref:Histone-lysine N-methyltransferase (Ash1) n=1 Tax=Fusarium albosuccineum TaxID=1237068 RepID=A0A8H4PDW2_9HYPO|nr:histone-lysine N-methyltransferase (Ash1) [Fusarium albosuccineum]
METAGSYDPTFFEPFEEVGDATNEKPPNETLPITDGRDRPNVRKRPRIDDDSANMRQLRQRHTVAVNQLRNEVDEAANRLEKTTSMVQETSQAVTQCQEHFENVQRWTEYMSSRWIDLETYNSGHRATEKLQGQYMVFQEYLESLQKAERVAENILEKKRNLLASSRWSTPAPADSLLQNAATSPNPPVVDAVPDTSDDMGRLRHLHGAYEQVQVKVLKKKRQIADVESLMASTRADMNNTHRSVRECIGFLEKCTIGVLNLNPHIYNEIGGALKRALAQQQDLEIFLASLDEAKAIAVRLLQELESSQTEITKAIPELDCNASGHVPADLSCQGNNRLASYSVGTWEKSDRIRGPVKKHMRRVAHDEGRSSKCICTERCDAACLNRYTAVECNADNCPLGDTDCGNRQFLAGPSYQEDFRVTQEGEKGLGLRTTKRLEPNQLVIVYRGEVLDEKEAKKRMARYRKARYENFYMMRVRRGIYIDATEVGSLARFVNHSCEPNCTIVPWVVGSELELGFFVGTEPIDPNKEITISYGFDSSDDYCPCYCGAHGCKGSMGGGMQEENTV